MAYNNSGQFDKRRAARKRRSYGYQQPKADSYLIVTEGKKTEPLYFRGLVEQIERKAGGNMNVYEVPLIDIDGIGSATKALVRKTEEIVSRSRIIYENVWVVFDKDDFNDFDEAIALGEKKGYKIAWSNQSFEYWIYLHFKYSDTPLHRKRWNYNVSKIFRDLKLGKGEYRKNYRDIYEMVDRNGGVNTAVCNARRRMEHFRSGRDIPSQYDPGTTVHLLVEELKQYLEE